MQRRKFAREFKLEAVKLVRGRGVAVAQAARDLEFEQAAYLRDRIDKLRMQSERKTKL